MDENKGGDSLRQALESDAESFSIFTIPNGEYTKHHLRNTYTTPIVWTRATW